MNLDVNKHHQRTDRAFVAISSFTVVVAAIAAFWLLGSPNQQRLISIDQERLSDLRDIARQLAETTRFNRSVNNEEITPLPEELPESLLLIQDPTTRSPYDYRRLSDTAYELCATFDTNSADQLLNDQGEVSRWAHPKGPHCFELAVDEPIPPAPYFRGGW